MLIPPFIQIFECCVTKHGLPTDISCKHYEVTGAIDVWCASGPSGQDKCMSDTNNGVC